MLKSICLLLVISTCAYSRDSSAILSRLFKKSTKNASPLILILDRNSLRPLSHEGHASTQESAEADDSLQYLLEHLKSTKNAFPLILILDRNSLRPLSHEGHASAQESAEADDSLQYLLEHLVQKSRPKSHAHKHLKSKDVNVYRPSQHYNVAKKQEDQERNSLRSPIYRSLLSLRNSLRCGARDECQDECSQNFKGIKEKKCNNKCEIKFDCEEPTTPKPCHNCDMDYEACSGSEQCDEESSTKGELVVTEKPGCTRC